MQNPSRTIFLTLELSTRGRQSLLFTRIIIIIDPHHPTLSVNKFLLEVLYLTNNRPNTVAIN